MPKPEFGLWRWTIHRWNEHPNPFLGRPDLALQWLRQYESEPLFLQELRRLIEAPAVFHVSDAQVLKDAAEQLSAGRLQMCGEFCGHYRSPATDVKFAEEEVIPPKAPPPAPAPSPPPSQEAPAPAAFSSNTDEQAQADALKTAAENGTPFCEECEKAKPKPAPTPKVVVTEATLPANVDPTAVAQVLKAAAENGTPFCAECLKARQG